MWYYKSINTESARLRVIVLNATFNNIVFGIYSYICNQCASLHVVSLNTAQARCTRYNIMWSRLSVTYDRSVVFSGYSGFLNQLNWFSCTIVESGIKHNNPKPSALCVDWFIISHEVNTDNVSDWSDISIRGLFVQCTSTIQNPTKLVGLAKSGPHHHLF
jgi:hypothetical protein